MTILADENIHSYIIQTLRDAEIKVISVSELSKGIKDEQVIGWALKMDYTILTEDKDFGEWVFAHHIQGLSVLFLRYFFQDYKIIAYSLRDFITTTVLHPPVFITITIKKIRIRQL